MARNAAERAEDLLEQAEIAKDVLDEIAQELLTSEDSEAYLLAVRTSDGAFELVRILRTRLDTIRHDEGT